jgi:hypothetical protein
MSSFGEELLSLVNRRDDCEVGLVVVVVDEVFLMATYSLFYFNVNSMGGYYYYSHISF